MAEQNGQLRDALARAMQPEVDWSRYNQPFGEMRGTAPEDTPAVFKTKTGVKITEGDIQRGIDVGMGAATVGGAQKGIKAYHSSPHDFDKFDLSKIGTGEGAQVYGHGLYFAENPAVSGQGGQYWNQFRRRFDIPERNAALTLSLNKFNREAAIAEAQAKIADPRMHHSPASVERARQELALLQSGRPVGPRTYEVSINADPRQMLDWDKRLAEQSPHVMDAARRLGASEDLYALPGGRLADRMGGPTGQDFYRTLANPHGRRNMSRSQEAAEAAMMLENTGIPGIRYLDAGSRGHAGAIAMAEKAASQATNPTTLKFWQDQLGQLKQAPVTSNYVVFDPNKVAIDKKYGIAAGLPTAGAAAAAAAASGNEDKM